MHLYYSGEIHEETYIFCRKIGMVCRSFSECDKMIFHFLIINIKHKCECITSYFKKGCCCSSVIKSVVFILLPKNLSKADC